jgi:hypothetical protein
MTCFFTNQGKCSTSKGSLPPPRPKTATKRPRAINAEDMFAKSERSELLETIKELRDGSSSASHSGEENLALYRKAKADAFSKLSASEKEKWEILATEHNERGKKPPPMSHIFE